MLLASEARAGKIESSDLESGQPSRERLEKLAAGNRAVMAPLTILDISLPPKHLTCSISQHTNKQTDAHTIQINTQTPRDGWKAKEHRQKESITQRAINPWLPTRTVSRHPLSTC